MSDRPSVIFGSRGMLARALSEELSSRSMSFEGVDLPDCDITRTADVAAVFSRLRPRYAFNCAAFTRVDACEDQPQLAGRVNGEAVGILAEMCRIHDVPLIHVSTDFVFGGSQTRPYRPDDSPSPVSAYGCSKLLGEELIQKVSPRRYAIVRTAWLFGVGGASFPRTMVELARGGKPLRVVNDQIGSPTYTVDLAGVMVDLALRLSGQAIYHCTNAGITNWYEFACQALRYFDVAADIAPISTAEYLAIRPRQARRPAYSVLDCSTLESAIGRPMRPWQHALADFRVAVERNGGF